MISFWADSVWIPTRCGEVCLMSRCWPSLATLKTFSVCVEELTGIWPEETSNLRTNCWMLSRTLVWKVMKDSESVLNCLSIRETSSLTLSLTIDATDSQSMTSEVVVCFVCFGFSVFRLIASVFASSRILLTYRLVTPPVKLDLLKGNCCSSRLIKLSTIGSSSSSDQPRSGDALKCSLSSTIIEWTATYHVK